MPTGGTTSTGRHKKTGARPARPRSKNGQFAAKGSEEPGGDPRPISGYRWLLATYGVTTAALTLALRSRSERASRLGPMDLVLYGLATEHLSRIITKDSITAAVRAPFTDFEGPAGEGEVNESPRGTGLQHAIGELLSCPFCAAQWVATGLVAGSIAAPALTTCVVSVSAAARLSDYLQLSYAFIRARVE